MTNPLALEFISALGMPPDKMVELVADLRLTRFGLAARPITINAAAHSPWNLIEDRPLVSRTRAAMHQHGVQLVLGEGFLIAPGQSLATHLPALDLMAELGAPRINAVSMGGDGPAAVEAFGALAALAAERGMRTTIEFLPIMPPANFSAALAFAEAAGIEVMVDAMHFFRSDSSLEQLATADPARIGHVQICDVPMPPVCGDYGREASQDRLPPGTGDLPLEQFITALPNEVTVGLEVPMLARAATGMSTRDLLAPAVTAARALLAAACGQSGLRSESSPSLP